jgi:hypothetical protein
VVAVPEKRDSSWLFSNDGRFTQGSRTLARCLTVWTLLASHPNAADFQNPFYVIPIAGNESSDRSPSVLQFKWHTSSLAIWSSFYLRSLESNDSRVSQVLSMTPTPSSRTARN